MSGRLDHSSAGHVDPGETYRQAAIRELQEELGITGELTELGKTISDEIEPEAKRQQIRHLFTVFECRGNPGTLAKGEVKNVWWADPKKTYEEMKRDPHNQKYCGGFKATLRMYLEKKNLK